MGYKKLPIGALAILLVAWVSVSACAPEASSAAGIVPAVFHEKSASISIPVRTTDEKEQPFIPGVDSHGVQNIAQVLSDWQQININGFGDPQTVEVSALAVFNGYLFAGTTNSMAGARIFRSSDGAVWAPVTQPGFGISHDIAPPAILDFEVFNSRLYASTGRGDGPGQIWRSVDGVNWAPMVISGFGNPDTVDITSLAVYNNMIYAGAINQISGAQIWRSFSGDSNTWTQVAPAVSGSAATNVTGFAVFNGALYAAVESNAPAQLWRTTGGAWTTVMNNGFGNSLTTSLGGMAVFGGYLYVGAGNSTVGAQLWRSSDGTSWSQAIDPGFGDMNNQKVEMVFTFQNQLYISVRNVVTGIELWRSSDGMVWEQVNQDGFGDSNNSGTNWSNATANFLSQLYVGTLNVADGGELWRMLQPSVDTPTPTPTDTPTPTPTDTPTPTSTDTPTPTSTDTPTPTPTDTPTPTSTDTPTPTPTDTPTPTSTDTPTSTPTPAPLANTPGKVTGGGTIGSNPGDIKVTFGITLSYRPGDLAPKGNLTYQDHQADLRLKATSFDLLVIDGDQAWITGDGTMDDGQVVEFEIEIVASRKSGQPHTFNIYIEDLRYTAGGNLTGGNLTIHK